MEKKIHHGRNLKRFREMLGIKQESLAFDLGDDWNQKKVSLLEQREMIDDLLLDKLSEVMKVPVQAFRNFDDEQAINIIADNFQDDAVAYAQQYKCVYNPLDKIIALHDDKIALYERMLKEKEDMVSRLEKLLSEK